MILCNQQISKQINTLYPFAHLSSSILLFKTSVNLVWFFTCLSVSLLSILLGSFIFLDSYKWMVCSKYSLLCQHLLRKKILQQNSNKYTQIRFKQGKVFNHIQFFVESCSVFSYLITYSCSKSSAILVHVGLKAHTVGLIVFWLQSGSFALKLHIISINEKIYFINIFLLSIIKLGKSRTSNIQMYEKDFI
jgi:hypothetical protein